MDNIESEIASKELELIGRLKRQNALLKTELEDQKKRIKDYEEALKNEEFKNNAIESRVTETETKFFVLKESAAKAVMHNTKIQKRYEECQREKLEILQQFENFVFQMNEDKKEDEKSRQIELMEFSKEKENYHLKILNLEKDIEKKENSIKKMKNEMDELGQKSELKVQEAQKLFEIKMTSLNQLLEATQDREAAFRQQIKNLEDELSKQTLSKFESKQIDFSWKTKAEELAIKLQFLEENLRAEKQATQNAIKQRESEKAALKEKCKQKLAMISEESDSRAVEMLVNYKEECNSLRAENKKILDENTDLKLEISKLVASLDSTKRATWEMTQLGEKTIKLEKRKAEELKNDLETKVEILESEKAEIMNDLDALHQMVEKLKQEKLAFQKENKVLITKLVNKEEYPAIHGTVIPETRTDKLFDKKNKTKKDYHKMEHSNRFSESERLHRSSKSLGKLSFTNKSEDLRQMSLMPSFLVEKEKNSQKFIGNKIGEKIKKVDISHFKNNSVEPSALEFIKQLKSELAQVMEENDRKTEQLCSLQGIIRDMSAKMRELSADYSGQVELATNLKEKISKLEDNANQNQLNSAKTLQDLIEANNKISTFSNNINQNQQKIEEYVRVQ